MNGHLFNMKLERSIYIFTVDQTEIRPYCELNHRAILASPMCESKRWLGFVSVNCGDVQRRAFCGSADTKDAMDKILYTIYANLMNNPNASLGAALMELVKSDAHAYMENVYRCHKLQPPDVMLPMLQPHNPLPRNEMVLLHMLQPQKK